ncbi:MAG: T9SS type A sorting domain-containing protein [Bacteroidetes bacterium SB0662_bin_6]|nr:T9SS type A sorting domain-containing protein [Bacteroidetes bacterium SB0668_bin_1]MYE03742.1 T9SS type A sorting domain-containing protein [Bacteroidetes bacterium SB0662_bin_6]
MKFATAFFSFLSLLVLLVTGAGAASAQNLEYYFSPEGSAFSDPFAPGVQNGARGLSGPFDLDGDGKIEILVAQHTAGGRIHVIENQGMDSWEHVYSTALLDSTNFDRNARYATGADLDGDGRGEIVYVAGSDYSSDNAVLTVGAYVWEYDGQGSDHYGDFPAAIGNFYELDGLSSANARAENMTALDIDNDDRQELLIPANGPNTHDVFYVLSLTGDIETGQAENTFVTWNIESRVNARDEANLLGGGSPNAILAGDMNGDGMMDISYHPWNNYNFFNGTVTGPDTVVLPDASTPNPFLQATAGIGDHAALFGGVMGDIDGDGNDEAFYTRWPTGGISVIDYDNDQSVLSITENELFLDVITDIGWGGIALGDLNKDGNMDVLAGGSGYTAASFMQNEPSNFLHFAAYNGGDPTSSASYTLHLIDTSTPIDSTGFNRVHRDSLGTMSSYYEVARSKQGRTGSDAEDPVFPSGVVFLGDADGDGFHEVALSFQGIDDSLQVIDEVFNVNSNVFERTVRETVPAPVRAFVRIYEFDESFVVSVEEDPNTLPTGFELHENYPNPFNPSTTIGYSIPSETNVTVRVYDITGRIVKTLVHGQSHAPGTYEIIWDGTGDGGQTLASGTYFYSLEYLGRRDVKAMILLK